MKKIIALVLALVLTVAASVAGTVAYLQAEDSDVNVMTLGNVKIEQIEQERGENGALQDFTQGQPAYPAVGPIDWAAEGVDVNGTKYKVFTDDLKNVVDKIVTVKNTGKSDAYVRTIIALEAPDYDPNDLIHVNVSPDGISQTAWTPVDINGVEYVYSVFTYKEALEAGEVSTPSLVQVFLDSKATNEDVAKFGDVWDIRVLSQAVQTEGFADAVTALNTAFKEATADNVAEWFGGMETPDLIFSYGELSAVMGDSGNYTLSKSFTADNSIYFKPGSNVTLNLNGQTLTAGNSGDYLFKELGDSGSGSMTINGNGTVNMGKGFFVSKEGTLTVNGGTYNMSDSSESKGTLYVQNSGKLIINDGTFISSDPDVPIAYCINGFIEINGGFFQNTANPGRALLNMGNNLNYINNQKITLCGGTFVNWNPMDSAFARPWTNPDVPALIVLGDGYKMVSETQSNGDIWYTVVPE